MSLTNSNEERRRIAHAYIRGAITEEEFLELCPDLSNTIQDKNQLVNNILNKQNSFKDQILDESIRSKSYKFIIGILLSNQQYIMNISLFKFFALSASLTELIPIEAYARKFKLSKNMKLALRLVLMILMTNYMLSFYSAIYAGIGSIPTLTLIFKNLFQNILNILIVEFKWQSNQITKLSAIQKAKIASEMYEQLGKLIDVVITKAQALGLYRMKLLGYEVDIDDIIDSVDVDGTLRTAYNSVKVITKNKTIDVTRSPSTLLTDEDLGKIQQGMLNLVPVALDLVTIDETSIINTTSTYISVGKSALSTLINPSNTLEYIKVQNYGSQLTELLETKLDIINPEIRQHINLKHFRRTGEDIDYEINKAIRDIYDVADNAKYDMAEAYTYQESFFGYLNAPKIYKLSTIHPQNPEKEIIDLSINMFTPIFPLIYLITLIYYLYSVVGKAYKYFKPQKADIEVLPDQRIRRRKSKSKSRSRTKY